MAIGKTELQVTWDTGSDSDELATGNTWELTSDNMSMATAAVKALIECKADQTVGTPASGDLVDFYAQFTLGDPDGAGADEYDSDGHDLFLCQIDLNVDDPGIMTVDFPAGAKGFRIRAVASGLATTDTAEVSCTVYQTTA